MGMVESRLDYKSTEEYEKYTRLYGAWRVCRGAQRDAHIDYVFQYRTTLRNFDF